MSAAAAQEPTMEEILASIRRIVSDDEPSSEENENDVLDLTPDMIDQNEPSASAEANEAPKAEPNVMDIAAEELQAVMPTAPEPAPAPAPANTAGEESLTSMDAAQAVSSAFGNLNHLVMSQNARTLDDIVTEMMRPMLREWLDDNLPPLVERLVKEEIQRISRAQ